MIRKKVRVLSTGPTAENMKEAGKMANNMELGITLQQAEKLSKENGTKERDCTGSTTTKEITHKTWAKLLFE